ncbi:MAG TPA: hypothetical protein VJ885_12945 [Thermoanaerobaculia bacterium]|nr:hypothetical protein [Thermoanaerobaculia bacterium]
MKRDAAWLLRRYRDGAAPDWRVVQVLERDLDRLIDGHSAIRPEVDELRRSAPERLRDFDTASDRALQCMGERRFDEALREIRKAASALAELRRFVAVSVDLRSASEALSVIEDLLSPILAQQPTVRILRRLRDLSRSLLDQGEPRKATFVILLLREQLELLRRRNTAHAKDAFESILSVLERRSREVAEQIGRLSREGHHHLAERLLEDLETDLAIKERSHHAAEMPEGTLGPRIADLEAVRQRADSVGAALASWLDGAS